MARETKVGLIVGLGVILFVSVFVSDYLSVPTHQQEMAEEGLANFTETTTNQPRLVITRQEVDSTPRSTDPEQLAAAALDRHALRHGPPSPITRQDQPIGEPPRRAGEPRLPELDIDRTPIAGRPPVTERRPIGSGPILDDPSFAGAGQIDPERIGPGIDTAQGHARVDLPETPLIAATPRQVTHTVASGETLTAIARKHYDGDGNLWRSIRDANPGKVGSNGEVLQGAVLVIPKRSVQAQDPAGELAEREGGNNDRPARLRVRMITVQSGDTLSGLAAEHLGSGGKWRRLMEVNSDRLDSPQDLRAGMKLRIPAQPERDVAQAADAALAGADEDAQETRSSAPNSYTVQGGDNLYRIAQKHLGDGDRYREIYEANKDQLATANDIRVGMKLKLPSR